MIPGLLGFLYPARLRNCRTCLTFFGGGNFLTASNFLGSYSFLTHKESLSSAGHRSLPNLFRGSKRQYRVRRCSFLWP
uniref:Secreted protein n=1 Tax=Trichogramma kaykai TaxID=54128 RepID=A0ABD2XGF8_9HYME